VRADDDVWAVDYDQYDSRDKAGYGQAASAAYQTPAKAAYGSYGYQAPAQSHGYQAPKSSYGYQAPKSTYNYGW
jgi:hypothetical protein